jgi:UTP-glucose-1-phosphate uridylyltransferase
MTKKSLKPTLFILAAGMGSRYGGLKQLDSVGPNGETIMDYSVYDAIHAGFGKVVFVVRHYFEEEFKEKIVSKYENLIPVEIVFQELEYLPQGVSLSSGREKPWGTNHALLMGRDVIHEPFGVINADDFYGRESFVLLAEQLRRMDGTERNYCLIGYLLGKTLSDSGSVARGECQKDENNYLTRISERTKIERVDGVPSYRDESGVWYPLSDDTPVSMNMWGFTPDYFDLSEQCFISFLEQHQHELKSEFLIPVAIYDLVKQEKINVKLIETPSDWFGVTYAEDKPGVVKKINDLITKGVYPAKLFK